MVLYVALFLKMNNPNLCKNNRKDESEKKGLKKVVENRALRGRVRFGTKSPLMSGTKGPEAVYFFQRGE